MHNKLFTKDHSKLEPILKKVQKKRPSFWQRLGAKKKKIKIWVVALLGLIAGSAVALWWFYEVPLVSPLTSLTTFNFITKLQPKSENKIVYGFLPYWNMDEVVLQPEMTHLAYFSLTIGANGNIITRQDGGLEPGFRDLQSEEFLELSEQMENNDGQVEIVLSQFDNDDIVALLSSPKAKQNLITSLDSILLAYPVNGVNIDIEYSGPVTEHLQNRFTELITELSQHLKNKYQGIILSIDMYAGASDSSKIWDVEPISEQVDYIVVMAYDFHRRSSSQAGPVAPLFGGKDLWNSDINQHLAEFLKVVPKEKILLGVPFYGYGWQTTSRDSQAQTYPDTGSTASFKRVQKILEQKEELQVEEHWNEDALSPYISYIENGETYIIYYENSRSLSYKLDYVNQLDLAGIAIWALGYEDNARELWGVVERKL